VGEQLPIFELPLVLIPGEQVPLHIFEERYKRMIGSCMETGEPFGVVLRDSEGARSVGCTAYVTEVLERFPDGRMNIVVTGDAPFSVLDRFDDPEDPGADVELLEVSEGETDPEAADLARESFRDLAERASGERPPAEELADAGSYAIAARIELPPETKQELLETRDEAVRMRMLARALSELSRALDRAEKIAERASSNGKVRVS
jgi:Lon protease-like protein